MTIAEPLQPLRASDLGRDREWLASLQLGFSAGAGRTRLADMRFHGPLRVQRPFYPEGAVCHIYLLHPPGGLVSGDQLQLNIDCQPGSQALLTTPSAGKIYRADSCNVPQRQKITLRLDAADCEWLPMETVVFDGANGCLDTEVHLHGDARYIGIDVVCLGRPASDKPFAQGQIEQRLAIYRDHKPLLMDRLLLGGDEQLLSARAGFRNLHVAGTLTAVGLADPQAAVDMLRAAFASEPAPEQITDPEDDPITGADSRGSAGNWLSITQRLGVLIVRYLGDDSETANRQLRRAWQLLRPLLLAREACVPRIWAT